MADLAGAGSPAGVAPGEFMYSPTVMDECRLERLLTLVQSRHRDRRVPVTDRICMVCTDALEMDGAGLSLLTTVRRPVGSSDEVSAAIERLQIETEEGPCFDALQTRSPVLQPDLRSREAALRWPRFAPEAVRLGVRSIFGFPIVADRCAIGALDVYSREPRALTDVNVVDALILADMAAITVASGEPTATSLMVDTEPEQDWVHPSIVHQASGMTSVQLGIGVDDALLRLRAHAFALDRRLADVAADIVARRLRLEAWHRD